MSKKHKRMAIPVCCLSLVNRFVRVIPRCKGDYGQEIDWIEKRVGLVVSTHRKNKRLYTVVEYPGVGEVTVPFEDCHVLKK